MIALTWHNGSPQDLVTIVTFWEQGVKRLAGDAPYRLDVLSSAVTLALGPSRFGPASNTIHTRLDVSLDSCRQYVKLIEQSPFGFREFYQHDQAGAAGAYTHLIVPAQYGQAEFGERYLAVQWDRVSW